MNVSLPKGNKCCTYVFPYCFILLFYFCLFFYLAKKKKVLGNKIQTHQYELVFIFMEINIKKTQFVFCILISYQYQLSFVKQFM